MHSLGDHLEFVCICFLLFYSLKFLLSTNHFLINLTVFLTVTELVWWKLGFPHVVIVNVAKYLKWQKQCETLSSLSLQ